MSDVEQYLKVLRLPQDNPDITQRRVALQLGISLGGLNYFLKALVQKGWVKMDSFSRSPNKFKYCYLLTHRGAKAKTVHTARFLKQKLVEYEVLRAEIGALHTEVLRSLTSTGG